MAFPGFLWDTHLQKEVSDTLIATAGGQHEGSLPFWGGHVHVHSCFQQQVHDVVVADVGSVHEWGPAPTVPLVQIQVSTKEQRKEVT